MSMTIVGRVLTSLALLLMAADAARAVSAPSGIDPRLRLEWEVGRMRSGRPEIQWYVYNDYMRSANNVRLLVETLDDQGRVIGKAYGYVFGVVPSFNRTPFDVPIKSTGPSYRVTVTQFDWRDGGPS
jgi:hypothetical protein